MSDEYKQPSNRHIIYTIVILLFLTVWFWWVRGCAIHEHDNDTRVNIERAQISQRAGNATPASQSSPQGVPRKP